MTATEAWIERGMYPDTAKFAAETCGMPKPSTPRESWPKVEDKAWGPWCMSEPMTQEMLLYVKAECERDRREFLGRVDRLRIAGTVNRNANPAPAFSLDDEELLDDLDTLARTLAGVDAAAVEEFERAGR